MSEADAVARSSRGPVTHEWLVRDLCALGVKQGMLLMVHASLSQLGWVIGGAETVIGALRIVVGEEGTLLRPTFDGGNSDPANWQAPPIPESWHQTYRELRPVYDPATTPSRIMGAIPEYFRSLPNVKRSAHPAQSWAALGPLAERVISGHTLDCGDGSNTPLGSCYELRGHVLSLATKRTTVLHLADFRSEWPGKHSKQAGSAMLIDGQRQWVAYEDNWSEGEDFEQLRLDYMAANQEHSAGMVAYGESRLFAVRPLVDYAVEWIGLNRK